MKKIFIILLSITSGLTAFSQEKGTFEFGFNAGYNLATVISGKVINTSNKVINGSYRSGFNAGAFGDYYLSGRWSIKAKLTYDQKGWNKGFLENLDNGERIETNYRMDYLTIPVMANLHFGKTRNWYLNLGPYAGILLSAKETAVNSDLKKIMNSTDFGLAIGVGVKIPIASKLKVVFEIDGQSGFTDIIKNNQGVTLRNSRSSFNTGLVFGL